VTWPAHPAGRRHAVDACLRRAARAVTARPARDRLSSARARAGHPSKASAIEMDSEHVPKGSPIPDHPPRGLPRGRLEAIRALPRLVASPGGTALCVIHAFGRMPVEPLRDREGRPTPSKSTFVIAHERSFYPDPQGLGTLPVAVRRCRGLEPARDRSVGRGPLCVPSREGRRASPHPKCLSSADTPEGEDGPRASSPAIGAFASVPIMRA
jgi:hypothetical protein